MREIIAKLIIRGVYALSIWIVFIALSAVLWPNLNLTGDRVLGLAFVILSWGLAGKLKRTE
jgi:hypothetical protein